jgi:hypothetical protein
VWVQYDLVEPYPAEPTLSAIRERLASAGWSALAYDWLNPHTPSSHTEGWDNFLDGPHKPGGIVDQWMAQWRNPGGQIVLYEFRYISPSQSFPRYPDRPDNSELHVTGMLASASLVRRMVAVSAKEAPSGK